eukprot:gene280-172_t
MPAFGDSGFARGLGATHADCEEWHTVRGWESPVAATGSDPRSALAPQPRARHPARRGEYAAPPSAKGDERAWRSAQPTMPDERAWFAAQPGQFGERDGSGAWLEARAAQGATSVGPPPGLPPPAAHAVPATPHGPVASSERPAQKFNAESAAALLLACSSDLSGQVGRATDASEPDSEPAATPPGQIGYWIVFALIYVARSEVIGAAAAFGLDHSWSALSWGARFVAAVVRLVAVELAAMVLLLLSSTVPALDHAPAIVPPLLQDLVLLVMARGRERGFGLAKATMAFVMLRLTIGRAAAEFDIVLQALWASAIVSALGTTSSAAAEEAASGARAVGAAFLGLGAVAFSELLKRGDEALLVATRGCGSLCLRCATGSCVWCCGMCWSAAARGCARVGAGRGGARRGRGAAAQESVVGAAVAAPARSTSHLPEHETWGIEVFVSHSVSEASVH